ncbi:MAG TPA: SCO family protein [Baekduia sp.]|nr:SCO family protein [Baekduia sp.]
MTRVGLLVRGLAGALVGLALAVLLIGLPGGGHRAQAGPGFEGSLLPPRTPAPDVVLHDEQGRRVALAGLRGRPYVVAFLSAVCQDVCPVTAQTVRIALDQAGGDVPAFAIAVDPPNDTALAARRFLTRQSLLGRMRFLLGTRAQLQPAWRGFAVQPVTATLPHQARIVLVDARGMQRVGYFADDATPEEIAHDLRLLEAEAAPAGRRV